MDAIENNYADKYTHEQINFIKYTTIIKEAVILLLLHLSLGNYACMYIYYKRSETVSTFANKLTIWL